jgi:hypothetical protein
MVSVLLILEREESRVPGKAMAFALINKFLFQLQTLLEQLLRL